MQSSIVMKKVSVLLQKSLNCEPSTALFADCILAKLGFAEDSTLGHIYFKFMDNKLVISTAVGGSGDKDLKQQQTWQQTVLKHPPTCPIYHLSTEEKACLAPEVVERGVGVAVSILLETFDHQVILTRRARHMRTFPSIWVPPGGHIEYGENILSAGLREFREEIGLVVEADSSELLGVWESVYPHILDAGPPRRHHVVVYLHLKSRSTWSQLLPDIKLDPEEVEACTALSSGLVEKLVEGRPVTPGVRQTVLEVEPNSAPRVTLTDVGSLMYQSARRGGLGFNRLSLGTHFALERWLERHMASSL